MNSSANNQSLWVIPSWMLDAYMDAGWKIIASRDVVLPGINRGYTEYTVVWDEANGPTPVQPDPSTFRESNFRDVDPKQRRR